MTEEPLIYFIELMKTFSPLLAVMVGGLITYAATTASERKKRKANMLDKKLDRMGELYDSVDWLYEIYGQYFFKVSGFYNHSARFEHVDPELEFASNHKKLSKIIMFYFPVYEEHLKLISSHRSPV